MNNFFGSIWDTITDAGASVIHSIEDIPAEWNAKVSELKTRAAEFGALFSDLSDLAPIANRDPQTKSQYDALMARGMSIKSKIQTITNAIDSMYSTASNIFSTVNGLGIVPAVAAIPLLPIAVIAGASTLIMYWITDAINMRNKLNAALKSGATGAQITSISTKGTGSSIADSLVAGDSLIKNAGIFLLIGAAVYFLAPAIKKALSK